MPFGTVQILIRPDFILPAAAIKVFRVAAITQDISCTVISDKVIFSGTLVLDISWVRAANNQVLVTRETAPFSGFVDIPGVKPGMGCQLFPDVEHVTFHLIDPRTIKTTGIIFIDIVVNSVPFTEFGEGITRVFDPPGFAITTN